MRILPSSECNFHKAFPVLQFQFSGTREGFKRFSSSTDDNNGGVSCALIGADVSNAFFWNVIQAETEKKVTMEWPSEVNWKLFELNVKLNIQNTGILSV